MGKKPQLSRAVAFLLVLDEKVSGLTPLNHQQRLAHVSLAAVYGDALAADITALVRAKHGHEFTDIIFTLTNTTHWDGFYKRGRFFGTILCPPSQRG